MLSLTKKGIRFADPTMQVLLIETPKGISAFHPLEQLEEASVFLKDNLNSITFIYSGEAGEYIRLPEGLSEREGNKWVGFVSTGENTIEIQGENLVALMQDIPLLSDSFFVFRG